MNIINLSLDPHLLDSESVAAVRTRAYGTITDSYTVIIPTPGALKTQLSDNVVVYGSGGVNKLVRIYNIYHLLSSLLSKSKVDVISAQDPYFLGLLGLFLARRHHVGLELHILGLEKLSWFRRILARFTLHRVSAVRVNSRRLVERLQDEFNVPLHKITYAPIYVDVDKIGLGIRSYNTEEKRLFDAESKKFEEAYGSCVNFLTVSRLVPVKRIILQLQAVEQLKKEFDTIRLHIVGPGPLEDQIKQEIHNRGLETHVILHGPKYGPELGVFYVQADCFVLTSESEGWGMVITEAATAGLPIVMTDVGCAGEFIQNGESGIVLPVHDTLEPLVEAMQKIITDESYRNMLVENAFKALNELPDLKEILSLYKKSWELAEENKL